jgi:hypothetical protein
MASMANSTMANWAATEAGCGRLSGAENNNDDDAYDLS